MLKRSLLLVALACGCSPAVPPVGGRSPGDVARSAPVEQPFAAARPHRPRHVARLAPPFAPSGLTRHVPDGEPMTALVIAP